jgi:hypothetical protein
MLTNHRLRERGQGHQKVKEGMGMVLCYVMSMSVLRTFLRECLDAAVLNMLPHDVADKAGS